MIALEVSINGERVFLAGIEDWDILHANLMARRAQMQGEDDEFEIDVGGLAQPKVQNQLEHVRWGRKKLSVGDAITIRIVQVSTADTPIKRYRSDREVQEDPFTEEEILEMQKEDYLWLKKKFEVETEGEGNG